MTKEPDCEPILTPNLSRLAASKTQITIAKRKKQEYLSIKRRVISFLMKQRTDNWKELKKKEENWNLLYTDIRNDARTGLVCSDRLYTPIYMMSKKYSLT